MKIKFLGHSTFQIETNGKTILTDPFITANELAKEIDINTINTDYILLTHAHQDHVLDVESIGKRNDATIISNYEITEYFAAKGLEKRHPMNTGGKWKFDFGTVRSVKAEHSSTFADGSAGGNPNGYIIESNGKKIYIAGDTALTYDMKLIPKMVEKLDLAILPIGDNFTMGIEDAILTSDFVECDKVLGCHFDTFGFIKIDHAKAIERFRQKKKELILLDIGSSLEI